MIKNKYIKAFLLSCLLFFTSSVSFPLLAEETGPVFFIGEDIIHPKGMVIAVNEISRKPFEGGFGVSNPKEDFTINLTLLNSSSVDFTVNLLEDFSLDLGTHHYKPLKDDSSRVSLDEINIGANTQSRIDLSFRVNQGEKETPELLFNFDGSDLKIICDEKLGKIVSENELSNVSRDDIAKAAKILIEAGRLTIAKSLCESILTRFPNDSKFLLLMAKIYSNIEDEKETAYYLKRIDVTQINGADEAEEAAVMAISIGYSDVALNILASFDAAGLLNDDQKALLARAYYYEDQLEQAVSILNKLFSAGYNKPKAYFTMGNICNRIKDYDQAIAYWEKTVELDSEYSEALFNIGVGYYKKGDTNKARDYWQKTIRSNPDSTTYAAAEEALKGTE